MVRKRLKLLGFSLLLAVIAVAAVLYLTRPGPVEVVVATITRGTVEDTTANTRAGTVKACKRAAISPAIGGQIAHLPVQDGDTVKAGDVLLELWNDDLRSRVTLAGSQTKAAQALARQTCVLSRVARREAVRLRSLRSKGLATEEASDKADGEAEAQAAACEAANANTRVNEAQLAVAQALLDRTRLTAPFDGIVAEINGEIGEFVTPSPVGVPTPPAVDLVDISCLYISAPVDEVDAPGVRTGMQARISLDAFPDRTFAGKVRRIAPYVIDREKQARVVDVEVNFVNAEDSKNMLPGYSADIEIVLSKHDDTLRIPTEAILEGDKVFVVGKDNLLREQAIETGLFNWNYTEVLSGLDAGEKVVISVDRDGVEDGAEVRIESAKDGRH
ncbi:HlyD family secretion protein [Thiogranum longum]|uniref:HlyD family secretion protein n=1 Tax=Thiogranum longum TaxID=1537524 RepID=A0A4R1H9T5_9GAMM|nr:efflux RND transporter periplasmic adaptor subunit [Thiogranum longum]TCK18068.1 HlyD family secretion protein [Thiogranum longum]